MERVAGMLQKYRAELAPVLSECPSAEDITSLAAGDIVNPSVLSHLECCEHYRDEVRLALEALQLEVSASEETPSAAHMAQVRRAVAREYGLTSESRCQSIVVKVQDFFAGFRIPSLVAAALVGSLVLLVVPHGPKEKPFRGVLSDAVWDTAPRMVTLIPDQKR